MNEEQTITNKPEADKYLPLYLLVSSCGSEPKMEELKEIIKCVHENFK